jgi:hypothetical protein
LVKDGSSLLFTVDVPFESPSGAGSVIRGGNTNGLQQWRTPDGKTLAQHEAEA